VSKKKAVIFEFNGTLAKKSGKPVKRMVKKALKDEKKEHVIILTGEDRSKVPATKKWLKKEGLGKTELDVRPEHNNESDYREKAHMLDAHISKQFKVKKAYDDKRANVKMFKEHGIDAKKV